jgi:hypothetical protein
VNGSEPPPLTSSPRTKDWDNPLAALIEQMQQNWDLGNNAANDEVVIQIRAHILRQRLDAALCAADPVSAVEGPPRGPDQEASDSWWMPEHTQAVADDVEYWSAHGVQVVSIRPRVDGSGAVIGVRRLTNHIVTAMQQRYSFPVYCWDASPLR